MYVHLYCTYVRSYTCHSCYSSPVPAVITVTTPLPCAYLPSDWHEQGVFIKKKEAAEEQYYTPKPLQRRRSKKEKMKATTSPKVPFLLHCLASMHQYHSQFQFVLF